MDKQDIVEEKDLKDKKEQKVAGSVNNKMMPTSSGKKTKVIMSGNVLHKGVMYRKGSEYEVDCETKKAVKEFVSGPIAPCNCK